MKKLLALILIVGIFSFANCYNKINDFVELKEPPKLVSPEHNSHLCSKTPDLTWQEGKPADATRKYEVFLDDGEIAEIYKNFESLYDPKKGTYTVNVGSLIKSELYYSLQKAIDQRRFDENGNLDPVPYSWTIRGSGHYQYMSAEEKWNFYVDDCEPPEVNILEPYDDVENPEVVKDTFEVAGVTSDNVKVKSVAVYWDKYEYIVYDFNVQPENYAGKDIEKVFGYARTSNTEDNCNEFKWFGDYCMEINEDRQPIYILEGENVKGSFSTDVILKILEEVYGYNISPGRHTITVVTCDLSGNCEEDSITIQIVKEVPQKSEDPDAPGVEIIPAGAMGPVDLSDTEGPWQSAGGGGGWGGGGGGGWGPWGWGWGFWGGGWGWFPAGWGGFGGFSYGDEGGWIWDDQYLPENSYECGTTRPVFTWSDIDDAVSYEFQLTDIENIEFKDDYVPTNPDAPGVWYYEKGLTNTYFEPPTDLANYAYIFRARAQKKDGTYSDWSSIYVAAVADLEAPTLIDPAADVAFTVKTPLFKWTEVFGASNYTLEIATDQAFNDIKFSINVTETQYQMTYSLEPGDYYWRVRANVGDICAGDWSESRHYEESPISKPTLDTTPCENNHCEPPEFTWSTVVDAIAYNFELAKDPNFDNIVISLIDNTTAYKPALTPPYRGDYYFRVRSANGMKFSDWETTCHWFHAGIDDIPTLANISNSGANSQGNNAFFCDETPYTFTWNATPNATKYRLYVSPNSDPTSGAFVNQTITGSTNFNYSFALNFGDYFWKVCAGDADCPPATDEGDPTAWKQCSEVWKFSIRKIVNPVSNMQPPNGDLRCDLEETFTWNAITEANRYQIDIASNNNSRKADGTFQNSITGFPKIITGTSQQLATGAVSNGDTVYWIVRGVNIDRTPYCYGPWASVYSITINELAKPTLTTFTTTCDAVVDFKWSEVSYANRYKIQIDNEPTFSSPVYQYTYTSLTPPISVNIPGGANLNFLPDTEMIKTGKIYKGTYYWRVQPINYPICEGDFSDYSTFESGYIDNITDDISLPSYCSFYDDSENPGYTWGGVKRGALNMVHDNYVWGGSVFPTNLTLYWNSANGNDGINLQVARDNAFTDLIIDKTGVNSLPAATTSFVLTATDFNKALGDYGNDTSAADFYWRVAPKVASGGVDCGSTGWWKGTKRFYLNILTGAEKDPGGGMLDNYCSNIHGPTYLISWKDIVTDKTGYNDKYELRVLTTDTVPNLWDDVCDNDGPGAENKRIYEHPCKGDAYITGTSTSIALDANKNYYWRVRRVKNNDEGAGSTCGIPANKSAWSPIYLLVIEPEPKPKYLTPTGSTDVCDSIVSLSWGIDGGSSNSNTFDVELISDDGSFTAGTACGSPSGTYSWYDCGRTGTNVTRNLASGNYTWRVRSINPTCIPAGESAWVETSFVVSNLTVPSGLVTDPSISCLAVCPSGSQSVKFVWDEIADANSYRIQISNNGSAEGFNQLQAEDMNVTNEDPPGSGKYSATFNITCSPNGKIYWHVAAAYNGCVSDYTADQIINTQTSCP